MITEPKSSSFFIRSWEKVSHGIYLLLFIGGYRILFIDEDYTNSIIIVILISLLIFLYSMYLNKYYLKYVKINEDADCFEWVVFKYDNIY